MRTGQGNPNKFSPKTINTHLRFEVSSKNVSLSQKKAGAPPRPPRRRRVSIVGGARGGDKRQRFIYQPENAARSQSEDGCLFDFNKCQQTQSSATVSVEKHVNMDLPATALFTLDFKGGGVITPLLLLTVLRKRRAPEQRVRAITPLRRLGW